MPSLLRDVLREAVTSQANLRLVPEFIRIPTVGAQVVELSIDTLVVASSEIDGRRLATQLLREVPHLGIVVLAHDSHQMVIYRPPLTPRTLPDPSLDGFLDAVSYSDRAEPTDFF